MKALQPLVLASIDVEAWEPPTDDDRHQQGDAVVKAGYDRLAQQEGEHRRPDDGADTDGEKLRWPQLKIGAREFACLVGAPVAALNDLVETADRA